MQASGPLIRQQLAHTAGSSPARCRTEHPTARTLVQESFHCATGMLQAEDVVLPAAASASFAVAAAE